MLSAFGPAEFLGLVLLSAIISVVLLIYIISLFRRLVLAVEKIAENTQNT